MTTTTPPRRRTAARPDRPGRLTTDARPSTALTPLELDVYRMLLRLTR